MKTLSLIVLSFFFLFTGCNNADNTARPDTSDGNISETTLPKGKYIVEDENPVKSTEPEPETISGYNKHAATPHTNTASSQTEDIKRRYKNLLVFHADDTMKIKKAYIATLVLGKDQILGDLKEEVLESSNANDDKIKQDTTMEIGSKMRARLVDMSGATNKGFDIELIGGDDAAEQSITDKRKKAIWQWKLTPLTPGQQELTLAITVIENNGDRVTLPTRNIPVLIFAEKESFLSQVGSFFSDNNSKWLVTAIVIPIIIAWFTTRMRHRSEMAIRAAADKQRNAASPNQNPNQNAVTPAPPQSTTSNSST